jgi:hypothetical protein
VTWTATATSGTAPLQYKWLVYDANGWAAKTAWTTSNTFAWTPTSASTEYRVGVWVKGANNTNDAEEASASTPFEIKAPTSQTITSAVVSANKIAPQNSGSTIIATATVSGGAAPYTFKWFIYDANGWAAVSGWTTSNTFTWTPSHPDPNYQIGVWVRQAGNTKDELEVSATLLFPIK